MNRLSACLLISLWPVLLTAQENVSFHSGTEKTTLIELYTSEGCSSCPPADAFLSRFRNEAQLWTQYIPLAFHVDYWDYIGWSDVFATQAFSQRQREHHKQGHVRSVYTPGFVIDGQEWTGFFKPWRVLPQVSDDAGSMRLDISGHQARVSYDPSSETSAKHHEFHFVVLGMGLQTEVKRGENAGRQLPHDFVVLSHQSSQAKGFHVFDLPLITKHQPQSLAVAAWVSPTDSLQPLQAVGGAVPAGTIKVL